MNRMTNGTTNRTMNQAANCTTQMNRITAPVLGLGLFLAIVPTIGATVHSVSLVLFELGRLSLAAFQIFCN
jgi:hypothetical protein